MISLVLPLGSTVEQAIYQSGLLNQFPNLDLNSVGIFSKPVSLDTKLNSFDRIEIYHPLLIDPKEARRRRSD